MYHILSNPYYMGVVSYQGIHYEGKHQPLIEPDIWLAVQDVLAAHNHTGEKDRIHTHYLRSTIYCSDCGGRLVFSRNVGRGGSYDYFLCLKKKTKANNCHRPAVRVEKIEEGIIQFYKHFQVRPEHAAQIQAAVRQELASQQQEATRTLQRATQRKQQAQDERQKLLGAHYAGAIPQDLLATEMKRLTRELAEAEVQITAAQTTNQDIEATLARALAAAQHCHRAYATATDTIRRQINQGFFVKLFIGDDGSVEQAELTGPFAALLEDGRVIQARREIDAPDANPAAQDYPDAPISDETNADTTCSTGAFRAHGRTTAVTLRTYNTTPRKRVLAGRGVNKSYLVALRGPKLNPSLVRYIRKHAAQG
jgi:hypothetical protein